MIQRKKVILASASPRRRELLANIGIEYICKTPVVEEKSNGNGAEVVKYNALSKAKCLVETGYAVIGADTVVCLDGKIYGKPKDEKQAIEFLKQLSGNSHKVYTGVAVVADGFEKVSVVETTVKFRNLSDDEILDYVKSGSPLDKAGAYGIQDFGGVFVEKIEGDYYNVVGLPIAEVYLLLSECGVISYEK